MKRLLVATVAAVLAVPLAGSAADAKPSKPKPDLVVSSVGASLSGGSVAVQVTVKNKGRKKAKASTTSLVLSRDTTASSDDTPLASLATAKLKAKKSTTLTTTAVLPATATGSYVVIACADAGGSVKEKKETNNCRAAAGSVTVAPVSPPAPPTVGIAYRVVAPGNAVPSAPAITATTTAGSCTPGPITAGSCTVPQGAATVTLTAAPYFGVNYVFNSWSGTDGLPCDGVAGQNGGVEATMTFTNATAAKSCTATYAGGF